MLPFTEIEKLCKTALAKGHDHTEGEALWSQYVTTREKVFKDLLPYIRKSEPFLTDHDGPHIIHVMDNAYKLLGKSGCTGKDSRSSLTTEELFLLILSILFHDVGNVFGRKGHQSRLEEAYIYARGDDQALLPEKRLLLSIVQSHGGETASGSPDTIEPLDKHGVFRGKQVDCQRVASILRLADELAEGLQRTSLFMQQYLPFPEDSQVFHDYAVVTTITIDSGTERIALVYHIDIAPKSWGNRFDEERLRKLLQFCYSRIVKLDLERRFNRHYCSLLRPFKKTEVSFHFYCKNRQLEINLPKVVLDDLILPGSPEPTKFLSKYKELELTALMPKLEELAGKHSDLIPH
jgi:hypothetical protein